MVACPLPATMLLVAALLAGCGSTPSPLAPGLRGSVGLPHEGVLTGGHQLPERGIGYRALRPGHVRWGNPRLVTLIEQASAEVARLRPGGAPLVVGDLSTRRGGRTAGHRSHRTGRDVDFLLYALTPDGRSVECPGFVPFGADGLAPLDETGRAFVRLDLERQWQLVRALLTSPAADVQWIFLARPLEALLIEYAQARGEPPDLLWRAETVLRQPSDSARHDDHLHVRVACSAEEAVAGCAGGGPRWPWLPPLPTGPGLSDQELVAALLGDG